MEPVVIKIDIKKRYEEIERDLLYRLSQAWGLQGLKHHIYCSANTYFFLEHKIDKLNYRPAKYDRWRIFIDKDVSDGDILLG